MRENSDLPLQLLFSKQIPVSSRRRSELLFHGTDKYGIEGIIQEGFRLPLRAGMFGKGIYFASNSSKAAQDIYTKGSEMLLLCEVNLGRRWRLVTSKGHLTREHMVQLGYDSVHAPAGTKRSGGVVNEEFVVYSCKQAYPKYVVHFREQ